MQYSFIKTKKQENIGNYDILKSKSDEVSKGSIVHYTRKNKNKLYIGGHEVGNKFAIHDNQLYKDGTCTNVKFYQNENYELIKFSSLYKMLKQIVYSKNYNFIISIPTYSFYEFVPTVGLGEYTQNELNFIDYISSLQKYICNNQDNLGEHEADDKAFSFSIYANNMIKNFEPLRSLKSIIFYNSSNTDLRSFCSSQYTSKQTTYKYGNEHIIISSDNTNVNIVPLQHANIILLLAFIYLSFAEKYGFKLDQSIIDDNDNVLYSKTDLFNDFVIKQINNKLRFVQDGYTIYYSLNIDQHTKSILAKTLRRIHSSFENDYFPRYDSNNDEYEYDEFISSLNNKYPVAQSTNNMQQCGIYETCTYYQPISTVKIRIIKNDIRLFYDLYTFNKLLRCRVHSLLNFDDLKHNTIYKLISNNQHNQYIETYYQHVITSDSFEENNIYTLDSQFYKSNAYIFEPYLNGLYTHDDQNFLLINSYLGKLYNMSSTATIKINVPIYQIKYYSYNCNKICKGLILQKLSNYCTNKNYRYNEHLYVASFDTDNTILLYIAKKESLSIPQNLSTMSSAAVPNNNGIVWNSLGNIKYYKNPRDNEVPLRLSYKLIFNDDNDTVINVNMQTYGIYQIYDSNIKNISCRFYNHIAKKSVNCTEVIGAKTFDGNFYIFNVIDNKQ